MDANKPRVNKVTNKIVYKLSNQLETSSGKAILASLRNSVGKSLSETADVWPLVFENMPDEFLGRGREETAEEKTILNTLQLFAIYQQGKGESVLSEGEEKYWENLGTALATLRRDGQQIAMDRRFNAMITSSTYEELLYHLRQMISLLKSKSKGTVKINFGKLSEDLYWFMRGYEEPVRISWGREYYRNWNEQVGEKE